MKVPKPRILWNAKDHPDLNSGYGIIGRHLLPRLGAHYGKENIIIYPPVYQRDTDGVWQGMKVVAGNEFGYGENLILDHYEHNRCNLLVMVGDAWPLGIVPDLAAADKLLWVQWLPVDWLGMPKNVTLRIKPAHKLVPFSKYGESSLRKAGFTNVESAIWLGLDLDVWHPMPSDPAVMDLLGYKEDGFNILLVAANQERKHVRNALEAISMFRRAVPNADARLYLHSHIRGERDLNADLDELSLHDITVFPDPYLLTQGGASERDMALVFNCADVVVNACMEGFGFAQLQAQACGVPVIVLSEGTGPELTKFGIEVPPLSVFTSPHQMAQPTPNPMAIAKALSEVWDMKQQSVGLPLRSDHAVQFVKENFGWDRIAEQWFSVIDQCMVDRAVCCMDVPEPCRGLEERAKERVVLK